MKIIIKWLVYAAAIFLSAYFIPGVHIAGFETALIVAVVLGLINMILRPILVILTLPINILTLGLFTLVINAALVMLAANFVSGFSVASFLPALEFALVLAVIHAVLNVLSGE